MSKQIFLIGDSIRMGYCEEVKKQLADRADVIFPPENCSSSQYIMWSLSSWVSLCRSEDTAVVMFNCGQWDAAHFQDVPKSLTSPEEYRLNLHAIISQLRKFFPQAKLLFATTTPMNPARPITCNPRTTEEIMIYNQIAAEVMDECDIAVVDLFAVAYPWGADRYVDHAHFTQDGYRDLADEVCRCIAEYV